MSKTPPNHLTPLDVIKAAGLLALTIGHMGFYIFPHSINPAVWGDNNLWLQIVGLWSLPVWFFLIGFMQTRHWHAILMGAVILLAANLVTGMYMFPLNPLVTLLAARMVIERVGDWAMVRGENLFMVCTIIMVSAFASTMVFEYGTAPFLFVLLGAMVRAGHTDHMKKIFWLAVLVNMIVQVYLPFDFLQLTVMAAGMAGAAMTMIVLARRDAFSVVATAPAALAPVIQFLGRRTLELYAGQLVIFKILGLTLGLGLPIYGWFAFDITAGQAYAPLLAGGTP